MKAAVLHQPGTKLAIEEIDLEKPRYGEVMVKIAATGLCYSDWHLLTGAALPSAITDMLSSQGIDVVVW